MLDRSLLLARHGYLFTAMLDDAERHALHDDGAVVVRFLGRRTLLVTGAEGVRFFYDDSQVRRKGAVPPPVGLSLFGPGAVHALDDEAHRHRKNLFRDVLTQDSLDRLLAIAATRWETELDRARGDDGRVSLEVFEAAVRVFGASVIEWAGIRASEPELESQSRRLFEIVDGFGTVGPAYLRAVRARVLSDRWARGLVREAREHGAPPGSWLDQVARFEDHDGQRLDERTAAVELLNVLRPTVAVAWLASFAAIALAENPRWREAVADDATAAEAFAHEVRRYYPFVPVFAARTRRAVEHGGHRLPRGHRVLLDVWGTNHGRDWEDPWAFQPARFLREDPCDVTSFVPQGGGDPDRGHRCPGEGFSNGLVQLTAQLLARHDATLPPQDRHLPMRRMPPRPASGTRVVLDAPRPS